MSFLSAVLLGLVQGLTEFLPVSSSGHLVLGGHLLELTDPHFFFDVLVHVATLLATIVFYRRSIVGMAQDGWRMLLGGPAAAKGPDGKLLLYIVVGSVPTAMIGLLFKKPLQSLFGAPKIAAAMLLVTATLLLATRFVKAGKIGAENIGVGRALLVGTMQGLAIVPGISRSGSTIACGLFLGLERELAARFSFLLSLPAVLGALLLTVMDGPGHETANPWVLAAGFVAAGVVGLLALAILIPLVRRGRLHWFAFYLIPAGLLGLWLLP